MLGPTRHFIWRIRFGYDHTRARRAGGSSEAREEQEMATCTGLMETLRSILETAFRAAGHATRSVHAKCHGLLRAELPLLDGFRPRCLRGAFVEGRIHTGFRPGVGKAVQYAYRAT